MRVSFMVIGSSCGRIGSRFSSAACVCPWLFVASASAVGGRGGRRVGHACVLRAPQGSAGRLGAALRRGGLAVLFLLGLDDEPRARPRQARRPSWSRPFGPSASGGRHWTTTAFMSAVVVTPSGSFRSRRWIDMSISR